MSASSQTNLASLEKLLVSGGDSRSALDTATGLNSYGCFASPQTLAISLGSSTANTISQSAWSVVKELWTELQAEPQSASLLLKRYEILRNSIKSVLNISKTDADLIFSPSGTDSCLHALFIVRAIIGSEPLDCILPLSDETGTGVPLALSGKHFSDITSEGVSVVKGQGINGLTEETTLYCLPRYNAGKANSMEDMDDLVYMRVSQSIAEGKNVLLQAMDCSKLGTRCPSDKCLNQIKAKYSERVYIVVDACQMRLSRERLNYFLKSGYIVLISGSKFFSGPSFSGGLLVPYSISSQLKKRAVDFDTIYDYTNRISWPAAWDNILPPMREFANYGQYFRWAAAIHEMEAFYAAPPKFRQFVSRRFAETIEQAMTLFAPSIISLADLDISAAHNDVDDFCEQTIFPFIIKHRKYILSLSEAVSMYRALYRDISKDLPLTATEGERKLAAIICQVGQPVNISYQGNNSIGAMRICVSSRMIADCWRQCQTRSLTNIYQDFEENLCQLFEKITLILKYQIESPKI